MSGQVMMQTPCFEHSTPPAGQGAAGSTAAWDSTWGAAVDAAVDPALWTRRISAAHG
jgi:hypothetical protein